MFSEKDIKEKNGMYIIGNSELLSKRCVSVVGSRKIDNQSIIWLKNIIGQIKNRVIVSGLALGTDAIAHQTAIDNNLPTVAILPSGVLNIQPIKNKKLAKRIVENGGALVSTYAPTKGIDSFSQYHKRNELIAKIGEMLIIPQFDEKSGTRSTVDAFNKIHRNRRPIIVQNNTRYSGNRYIMKSDNYFTLLK